MAKGVEFTVDATQVKQKASELRDKNEKLKTLFGNLQDDHDKLNSMWEGEAKNEFDNAFNKDKEKMDKFIQGIEEYCRNLEDIAKAYETAEKTNTSTAKTRTY